jgi:hypothetical protein
MRDHYQKKLHKMLSRAGNEEFIQLLWAVHILQSENPDPARKFILPETIPDGAISAEMPSEYSIHKWEIETLANELMTVRKNKPKRNGRTKTLRWDHFGAARDCVNWLRKLENSEYRIQKKQEDIFIEMGRIAARQFDWQRGFVNMPQFYRNAFVYGQGPCAAQFEKAHGITLNRFSQIGFMLYVAFTHFPVVGNENYWAKLDVTWEEVEKVLALIALPYAKAAKIARVERRKLIHTADKPSILRQAPCLRFGATGERIRAPLPELILERVTSGVFYDVVGGGGPIRDDYGRRFEDYCARYLSETLPDFEWEREFSYRKKPNNLDTPDILCKQSDRISIAFECKATRMSQEAMFGINPIEARGYQDITKAVFQLWRFFSHCRRGYVERAVSDDAVGVVLTLDNWLVMADTLRKQVLADAEKMAREKDADISEVDRKPIVFVAVPELERTLSVSTEATFLQALKQSNTEKYWGWRLDSVHSDLNKGTSHPKRKYPFSDELGQLLPWWDELGEERAKRAEE